MGTATNAGAGNRAAATPTRGGGGKASTGAGKAAGGGGSQAWSPIDMAVRPLQAFAAIMLKQVCGLGAGRIVRLLYYCRGYCLLYLGLWICVL